MNKKFETLKSLENQSFSFLFITSIIILYNWITNYNLDSLWKKAIKNVQVQDTRTYIFNLKNRLVGNNNL